MNHKLHTYKKKQALKRSMIFRDYLHTNLGAKAKLL